MYTTCKLNNYSYCFCCCWWDGSVYHHRWRIVWSMVRRVSPIDFRPSRLSLQYCSNFFCSSAIECFTRFTVGCCRAHWMRMLLASAWSLWSVWINTQRDGWLCPRRLLNTQFHTSHLLFVWSLPRQCNISLLSHSHRNSVRFLCLSCIEITSEAKILTMMSCFCFKKTIISIQTDSN